MIIIVFHQNKLTKLLLTVPWSCSAGGWGPLRAVKEGAQTGSENTGDEVSGWERGTWKKWMDNSRDKGKDSL